jgi:hypothetical protein
LRELWIVGPMYIMVIGRMNRDSEVQEAIKDEADGVMEDGGDAPGMAHEDWFLDSMVKGWPIEFKRKKGLLKKACRVLERRNY